MKKIVEYFVIFTTNTNDFDERIKAAINEGFQPFGSPNFEHARNGCYIYQAMAKYEDETKDCMHGVRYLLSPCCCSMGQN